MRNAAVVILFLFFAHLTFAQTAKDKEKFTYITTQMKLSKEQKTKLQPIFYAYRKDLRAAKSIYDDLKDRYLTSIKKKTLTAEQAKALNNAHWQSDQKVVEVRRTYTPKFYTVLSPQQTYELFSLANDSKTKRAGK